MHEQLEKKYTEDAFYSAKHHPLFINTEEIERENERMLQTANSTVRNNMLNDSFGATPTASDFSTSTKVKSSPKPNKIVSILYIYFIRI